MGEVVEMIGAIIILAIIADGVVRIIKAARPGRDSEAMKQQMEDVEAELSQMEDELNDAKQRIAVLEEIVTDDKYQLHKELNDLAKG